MQDDGEAFVAAMSGPLVGSLTLVLGSRAIAEEIAQDALAKALVHWQRIGTYDRPEAWVYKVALNLARSWFRRLAAERRAYRRAGPLLDPAEPGPEEQVTTAMVVRTAVAGLPDRQREVLACRFYADLSVGETAAAMGCAEGTVKALTNRAVTTLRRSGLAQEVSDV